MLHCHRCARAVSLGASDCAFCGAPTSVPHEAAIVTVPAFTLGTGEGFAPAPHRPQRSSSPAGPGPRAEPTGQWCIRCGAKASLGASDCMRCNGQSFSATPPAGAQQPADAAATGGGTPLAAASDPFEDCMKLASGGGLLLLILWVVGEGTGRWYFIAIPIAAIAAMLGVVGMVFLGVLQLLGRSSHRRRGG